MLRKLMKHEFRATGRVMLPLYLVLLLTAVGANISTRGMMGKNSSFLNILGGLLVTAFAVAIIGVCVMALVLMVQRFYKNLLGDEGYIMMTLPASVHQQIWSKLMVSFVWFVVTMAAVCLASVIMAYQGGLFRLLFNGLRSLFDEITAYYALNGTALILEFLLEVFLACCVMCLQFYAALSVGHSFVRHKMAWSVLFFFIFQFAAQFLGSMLIVGLDETPFYEWLWRVTHIATGGMAAYHATMAVMALGTIVYGAIFYGITVFFMKKHLNLE